MSKINIVMADDHHVVRKAIADLLSKEPDIQVIGDTAETTFLLDLVEKLKPTVLLLDANMPGPNVIEVAKALKAEHQELKILVLSAFDRREQVVGLLGAGVNGFILKDEQPETLVQAIRLVAAGEEWLSPRVTNILLQSIRNNHRHLELKLTRRETEVLRLMVTGAGNEEIADKLAISTNTVKSHVSSILRKLDVKTRVEAVIQAIDRGLV